MERNAQPEGFEFGPFVLTGRPLALQRGGRPVSLRPQAVRLLLLFASRAGELVTQAEIREHIWGGRRVEFGRGMHLLVAEIRQALGDSATDPAYLQTLPRQGYRFVAPAVPLARSVRRPHRTRSRLLMGLSGAAVALVGIGLIMLAQRRALMPVEAPPEAVAEYRKGAYLLAGGREDELERAMEYFRAALRLEPAYADPLAGLATAARRRGDFDLAETRARSAIAIHADHGRAHLELGLVAALRDWRWEDAIASFRRALDAEPSLADAHTAMAAVLIVIGEPEAALDASNRAYAADPVSALIRVDHGWFHYYGGDFGTAYRICGSALALQPDNLPALLCQYKSASLAGAREPALDAARSLLESWRSDGSLRQARIVAEHADTIEEFRAVRRARLEHLQRTGFVSPEACATAYAELGDFQAALDLLERAAQHRSPNLPLALRDPVFRPVAGDGRFRDLLRQVGLAEHRI